MQSRQIGCLNTPVTAKPAALCVNVNELSRQPPRNQTNVARRKAKVTICTKFDSRRTSDMLCPTMAQMVRLLEGWYDADDGWGLGSVTGLQQAMCGEPAAKGKTGASEHCAVPHARACVDCAVLGCAVGAWCVGGCCLCGAPAGCSLARSLVRCSGGRETQSGGFKHSLSLFLHPHPLHEGLFDFG